MSKADLFYERLTRTPVIPGIKDKKQVAVARDLGVPILFYLTGSIFDLIEVIDELKGTDVMLFAHVDLLEGIGKDQAGLRYLAEAIGVTGILSTRSFLLKAARKQGLLTIQRVFALDTDGIRTGISVVQNTSPTAIEILPAPIAPRVVQEFPLAKLPPVIAGGLIKTEKDVEAILKSPGIHAVSASSPAVWKWLP